MGSDPNQQRAIQGIQNTQYPDWTLWQEEGWALPEEPEWNFSATTAYHGDNRELPYPSDDAFGFGLTAKRRGSLNLKTEASIDRGSTYVRTSLFNQWDFANGKQHLRLYYLDLELSGRQRSIESGIETLAEDGNGGKIGLGVDYRLEMAEAAATTTLRYDLGGMTFEQTEVEEFETAPLVIRSRGTLCERVEIGEEPQIMMGACLGLNGDATGILIRYSEPGEYWDLLRYAYEDKTWGTHYRGELGFSLKVGGGTLFGLARVGVENSQSFTMRRKPDTLYSTREEISEEVSSLQLAYQHPDTFWIEVGAGNRNPYEVTHRIYSHILVKPGNILERGGEMVRSTFLFLNAEQISAPSQDTANIVSLGGGVLW